MRISYSEKIIILKDNEDIDAYINKPIFIYKGGEYYYRGCKVSQQVIDYICYIGYMYDFKEEINYSDFRTEWVIAFCTKRRCDIHNWECELVLTDNYAKKNIPKFAPLVVALLNFYKDEERMDKSNLKAMIRAKLIVYKSKEHKYYITNKGIKVFVDNYKSLPPNSVFQKVNTYYLDKYNKYECKDLSSFNLLNKKKYLTKVLTDAITQNNHIDLTNI